MISSNSIVRTVLACTVWLVGVVEVSIAEETTSISGLYAQQEDLVIQQSHGLALTMDVFRPTKSANGLAIVDVASGAWSSDRGKIRDHKRAMIYDIFCGKGYTVFAVRPGSVSRFSADDMVGNVERSIRWVKDNAADYQIDSDRIGLIGASAGGHLASLTAVRKKESVAAVGVFFPPTDFLQYGQQQIDPTSDDSVGKLVARLAFPAGLDGLSEADITAGLTAISPARQVTEGLPPFLLIHGDADPVVPLQQSETFKQALEAKQVDVQLIVKPGGGHPWLTIPVEVKQMADWFDVKLKATDAEDAVAEK
ncbi:MAG: alpha/beta hydrolase [Pirellulaceae bacterium]